MSKFSTRMLKIHRIYWPDISKMATKMVKLTLFLLSHHRLSTHLLAIQSNRVTFKVNKSSPSFYNNVKSTLLSLFQIRFQLSYLTKICHPIINKNNCKAFLILKFKSMIGIKTIKLGLILIIRLIHVSRQKSMKFRLYRCSLIMKMSHQSKLDLTARVALAQQFLIEIEQPTSTGLLKSTTDSVHLWDKKPCTSQ